MQCYLFKLQLIDWLNLDPPEVHSLHSLLLLCSDCCLLMTATVDDGGDDDSSTRESIDGSKHTEQTDFNCILSYNNCKTATMKLNCLASYRLRRLLVRVLHLQPSNRILKSSTLFFRNLSTFVIWFCNCLDRWGIEEWKSWNCVQKFPRC